MLNMKPLIELLDGIIPPEDLAKHLDELMCEYAQDRMQEDSPRAGCNTRFYYLKLMRDALLESAGCC